MIRLTPRGQSWLVHLAWEECFKSSVLPPSPYASVLIPRVFSFKAYQKRKKSFQLMLFSRVIKWFTKVSFVIHILGKRRLRKEEKSLGKELRQSPGKGMELRSPLLKYRKIQGKNEVSERMVWLKISVAINYRTECLTQSSQSNSKCLGKEPAGLGAGCSTANKWCCSTAMHRALRPDTRESRVLSPLIYSTALLCKVTGWSGTFLLNKSELDMYPVLSN